MKYALFGDFHGVELNDLEAALRYENPDVLICTGDFDQIRTVHQFMDLERKYNRMGKGVIKVPGNHDHGILNNLPIRSGTLREQGKTISDLHKELNENLIGKAYIKELVLGDERIRFFLDEDKFGKEYQTIVIHGAYEGDLSSFPDCPAGLRDLWTRLRTEKDYRRNFEVMAQKDYGVMIRGHDHNAIYVYNDSIKGIVDYTPEGNGSQYKLFRHRQHTINPGALFDGIFAVIDTSEDVPILRYVQL